MTPLLQAILNDNCQPVKRQKFDDQAGILSCLAEAHPFECTEVASLARDWAVDLQRHGHPPGQLAFLPAPVTWLEFKETSSREAWLLRDGDAGLHMARIDLVLDSPHFSSRQFGTLWLRQEARNQGVLMSDEAKEALLHDSATYGGIMPEQWELAQTTFLYALLAMINTPRVIGRLQHQPHAGLQRKLAAAKGMVGKFPLLGWTEIKLDVTPPEETPLKERETHLTGERALHFCRAYLWVSRGVVCPAHWRGNPAIGIRQTRYRLVAEGSQRNTA